MDEHERRRLRAEAEAIKEWLRLDKNPMVLKITRHAEAWKLVDEAVARARAKCRATDSASPRPRAAPDRVTKPKPVKITKPMSFWLPK
ncbi:MAG: hypothetical protein ACREUF_02625 [Solimonas sp.]